MSWRVVGFVLDIDLDAWDREEGYGAGTCVGQPYLPVGASFTDPPKTLHVITELALRTPGKRSVEFLVNDAGEHTEREVMLLTSADVSGLIDVLGMFKSMEFFVDMEVWRHDSFTFVQSSDRQRVERAVESIGGEWRRGRGVRAERWAKD